ncbi:hypothetical protein OIDMADRAFT_16307 [Oidiodendron maius Zn]|uniref:Uncharacterized protein n=1 Tax=Oidiodendron maius (strain Zn) TaxID=913774 RepID=A0A0C3D8V0_OIDMZ|nr:hypothetical protein OIDMADRAFT_16307 [Oidiodendron maius Zn]
MRHDMKLRKRGSRTLRTGVRNEEAQKSAPIGNDNFRPRRFPKWYDRTTSADARPDPN